jgi:hypothetical protein
MCACPPILPTMLAEPHQNGRLGLNAAACLSLFMTQLAFSTWSTTNDLKVSV